MGRGQRTDIGEWAARGRWRHRHARRRPLRAAFVAGVPGALVVVLVAVTLHSPLPTRAVRFVDQHVFLPFQDYVVFTNGITARADGRIHLPGTRGQDREIIRMGNRWYLDNKTTGHVTELDVANLRPRDPRHVGRRDEVDITSFDDKSLFVERKKGVVRVDAGMAGSTLSSLAIGGELSRAIVDRSHTGWVVNITTGSLESFAISPDGKALTRGKPTKVVDRGQRNVELALLDDRPVILDRAHQALLAIDDGEVTTVAHVPLEDDARPVVPRRAEGGVLPIAVEPKGVALLVDTANAHVVEKDLEAGNHRLGEPVTFDGKIFVPDHDTGKVPVIDKHGRTAGPDLDLGDGPVQLHKEVDRLWFNNAETETAFVMEPGGGFRAVDKGNTKVPGNDRPAPTTTTTAPPVTRPPAPAQPAATPTPPRGQDKAARTAAPPPPTVEPSPPAAPPTVSATAGNASATVTWQAPASHGAAIERYRVRWTTGTGTEGERSVDGAQAMLTVPGLRNGVPITFTVSATNRAGEGPATASNTVTPSSAVPDPPAGVTATAGDDGSVALRWDPADGQGHPVVEYRVFADSGGGGTLVKAGVVGTNARVEESEGLRLGREHTFTVVAVNDAGTASAPSSPSLAVTPRRPPQAVTGLKATASGRGGATLTWSCDDACASGDPVQRFTVQVEPSLSSPVQDVDAVAERTSYRLNVPGLADGTQYRFTVTAVNGAGSGAAATAGMTSVDRPVVTLTGASANGLTVTVTFTVENRGATVTQCGATLDGITETTGSCGAVAVNAPRWASSYAAHAWVVSAEFGRQDTGSTGVSTPARRTNITDNGVPFVADPNVGCQPVAGDPCPNRVEPYRNRPYAFDAVCQRRAAAYWRSGTSSAGGYAYWWIKRSDGRWAPNLWTDTANASADQPDSSLPQC